MYDKLISTYVNKLTEEDIKNYALKEQVVLSDYETALIHRFIKENYQALLQDDGLNTLRKIKPYLSITLYTKIEKKYLATKNTYFH